MRIEFHADDYGLFPAQSRRILDCYEHGVLNGISIMPNSPYLAECMELVRPVRKDLQLTVHLNLVEGKALTPAEEIPHLTDSSGIFRISFGKLLFASYNPLIRQTYYLEIKKELRAQITRCLPYFSADFCQTGDGRDCPEGGLRLDAHVHYQMLPVFYDALCDLIREENWKVTFIRVPRENTALYKAHRKEIHDLTAINKVKVLVLNFLARRNEKHHPEMREILQSYDFIGVMLSGHMCLSNVKPLLADAEKAAGERGRNLEILFHPGSVLEKEDIALLTSKDDLTFLTSPWRAKEAQALRDLQQARE